MHGTPHLKLQTALRTDPYIQHPRLTHLFPSTLRVRLSIILRCDSMLTFPTVLGRSIRINTVSSSHGGVFSLLVDGFNVSNTIDTYTNDSIQLPICYPQQFPPFIRPPPGWQTKENHNITLVYIGPSANAPNGSSLSNVQFEFFSIPNLLASSSVIQYYPSLTLLLAAAAASILTL